MDNIQKTIEAVMALPLGEVKIESALSYSAPIYIRTDINNEDLQEFATGYQRLARQYNELILAVISKYPNESRHETALRYVQERENHPSGSGTATATLNVATSTNAVTEPTQPESGESPTSTYNPDPISEMELTGNPK